MFEAARSCSRLFDVVRSCSKTFGILRRPPELLLAIQSSSKLFKALLRAPRHRSKAFEATRGYPLEAPRNSLPMPFRCPSEVLEAPSKPVEAAPSSSVLSESARSSSKLVEVHRRCPKPFEAVRGCKTHLGGAKHMPWWAVVKRNSKRRAEG